MTIEELIKKAQRIRQTDDQREAQRRSFAYGNANLANALVTREMIDAAAAASPVVHFNQARDAG